MRIGLIEGGEINTEWITTAMDMMGLTDTEMIMVHQCIVEVTEGAILQGTLLPTVGCTAEAAPLEALPGVIRISTEVAAGGVLDIDFF